uniref:Uncharacterized protein n=1 Tax=Plectus sambesii TaxID=2011161 RepID=A0A914WVA2_9BILA
MGSRLVNTVVVIAILLLPTTFNGAMNSVDAFPMILADFEQSLRPQARRAALPETGQMSDYNLDDVISYET